MEDVTPNSDEELIAKRLLDVVYALTIELHPHLRGAVKVGLDSDLDRDLSFDSLGRAELLLRLDKEFRVHLPENLIAEADKPRDLLDSLLTAASEKKGALRHVSIEAAILPDSAVPTEAQTLTEVMAMHVKEHGERKHLCLWKSTNQEICFSYSQLHQEACKVAAGLLEIGLLPGQRVAIMLATEADFFKAFLGVIYAGGVAVPIYPPLRRSQVEDHLKRQAGILRNAQAAILITASEIRHVASLLFGLTRHLKQVKTVDQLTGSGGSTKPLSVAADDPTLIQYTSGSTGAPKGVVLTHANLLANIRAMGQTIRASSADVFISWLPLYHDMGLIGAWFGTMYFGVPVIIMSPLTFLADPARWLWAIHHYQATLTAAPNFAFELCLKNIQDEEIKGLDLSSLRMMLNGAEPVSPSTIARFTDRFKPYGFSAKAMAPVYGLAESSVGLAFPPLERLPIVDKVDREELSKNGKAIPVDSHHHNVVEFVSSGQPLPGHEVRILDDMSREVPDRHQGRLEFRGPSTTQGYFRNKQKTDQLFNGEWLDSGDLAYIADGEIYITSRIKDIIIRAGRNIYPHELEELIGNINGVRKGCVAVFASADDKTGTERLIVLAETRLTQEQELNELRKAIIKGSSAVLEMPPDDVVLAPPRTIPKTSSGKIRRSSARTIYETGEIGERGRALWWQLARLGVMGLRNRASRGLKTVNNHLYAGYWWVLLVVMAIFTWISIMVLPNRNLRHALIGKSARLFLKLAGHRLIVEKEADPEPNHAMLVANHSSYLDALVLSAVIPGRLSFVAKQELKDQFVAGNLLKRIGTLFVRRQDTTGSIVDTTGILQAAENGERIMSFPEGTLTRMPGLLGFHLGAFVVATQADIPVYPITIQGTRSILRSGQWFPSHGSISVHIGKAIQPEGDNFDAAVALRDKVRAEILKHSHEPDLFYDQF